MRNRLIHAYFDVDLDIGWTTISEDLPLLVPVLASTLGEIDRWVVTAHFNQPSGTFYFALLGTFHVAPTVS